MDNNTNNFDELTLIRSQLTELKKRLDEKVKIDEHNVRKLIKRNARFINNYLIFAWSALPIIAMMFIGIKYAFALSWAVTAVIIAGCALDAYFDTRFNRMRNADIESLSLVEMAERLTWMKNKRRKQFYLSLPLVIIVLIWFVIELYISIDRGLGIFPSDHLFAVIMVCSVTIGGILGGTIGYLIYRKMNRDSDDVMKQIEELKQ